MWESSVDVEPELVELARDRLALIGEHPKLGSAVGRFAPFYAGFMPQRRHRSTAPEPSAPAPAQDHQRRTSQVDPSLLPAHEPLAMIAQLRLPPLEPRSTATTEDGRPVTILTATDGSLIVEDAHDWWTKAGRPGWDRFGLTATQNVRTIWIDEPRNKFSREPATTEV
jgi:hypothetical protein